MRAQTHKNVIKVCAKQSLWTSCFLVEQHVRGQLARLINWQASSRWKCFGRAEAASSIDCLSPRLVALICCSAASKAVLHQSEAGNSCAALFLVPFMVPLISWENRLDESVSRCPEFSVSEPQEI